MGLAMLIFGSDLIYQTQVYCISNVCSIRHVEYKILTFFLSFQIFQGFFLDGLQRNNTCSSNTDCPGGCCHLDYHGTRCHNYSHEAQPCHLPNHHINVMLYPCGCAQGTVYQEMLAKFSKL